MTRVNTMELDTVKKTIFDDVKKNSNLKISTQRQETNQIRDQIKRKQKPKRKGRVKTYRYQ